MNEKDCVDLGLLCASACTALNEALEGGRTRELDLPMLDAIGRLNT